MANRIFASPRVRYLAKQKDIDLNTISGSGPNHRIIKRDIEFLDLASTIQTSAEQRLPPIRTGLSDIELVIEIDLGEMHPEKLKHLPLNEPIASISRTSPELDLAENLEILDFRGTDIDRIHAKLPASRKALLTLGAIALRPVARDGQVILSNVMTVGLTIDAGQTAHESAALWLCAFKDALLSQAKAASSASLAND